MDHFAQLRQQIKTYLFFIIGLQNLAAIALFWALQTYTGLSSILNIGIGALLSFIMAGLSAHLISGYVTKPMQILWQAILHISPAAQAVAAPKIEELNIGRELVAGLTAQVYQLANLAESSALERKRLASDLHADFIAQNLPLPLFVLDPTEMITFANEAAAKYLGIAAQDMIGKNVYMVLDMSFPSEETFDAWLKEAKSSNATASSAWERVRLMVRDNHPERLFDLAAYYNRDNPDKHETVLVMFDHTKQYSQDDQSVSFTALSVHELRTPLTLLRGYIEVFEEEINTTNDPELKSFMLKMRATADQLMAFVNNILNVARVEDDQLELKLNSEDWPTVLKAALNMISLRAKVRDISLEAKIHPNLPPVGIDRISITEVINNLIDNAIKYSGQSKSIKIETYVNKDGLVETIVQDYGLGISTSVLPNLFTKFYRDHRNRAQIGGTGLGLYLCKAIVTAHGGNIWVRSQEGKGSSFGFTIVPYEQLPEASRQNGAAGVTRSAHGWIKNHSLYRR